VTPSRSFRRWPAAAEVVAALGSGLAACDRGSSETDQQIADLRSELASSQTELSDTQTELEATQAELKSTENQLSAAQAELLDAQAQLAKVGEVVLADGTYVGQVLGAKASPYRAIVFNAAGLFRVAQVSSEVKITAGGDTLTLSHFGKLLSSTNPDKAKLANGSYQVIVKKKLVTSIRKSKA